ncbi:MAG TPA: squalene synthase HpnC [Methylophaga sp.]|nr:squalene synthase HpnC [Methylophaga sp.]
MTATEADIDKAYTWCQQLAKSHYENFPVASALLPGRLRRPIAAIYAFARTADDFADEGDAPQSERLAKLNEYSLLLQQIKSNHYSDDNPIFIALQDAVREFALPVQLFEDLLIAFRQDVLKSRYANFDEVMDYCRYSANPIGRLLLYLQGQPNDQQLQQSDAICSALQLINFYQDIEQDLTEQNRLYLPQDLLANAGLEEKELLNADSQHLAPILRYLYQQTSALMQTGIPLGADTSGGLGWEIRAMTLGGIMTLSQLNRQSDKQLLSRPRLSRWRLAWILAVAAHKSLYLQVAYKYLKTLPE